MDDKELENIRQILRFYPVNSGCFRHAKSEIEEYNKKYGRFIAIEIRLESPHTL